MNRPTTARSARVSRRKNVPCVFDLAGVKFLLKKGKDIFLRDSALNESGRWRGFNTDSVLPKLFSGERIWQNLG
jgi:hypothetical protein